MSATPLPPRNKMPSAPRAEEEALSVVGATSLRTLIRVLAQQAAHDAFQSALAEAEHLAADATTRPDPDTSCHD